MNLNDFKCFLNDFLPINNFLICINPAKKDDNFILPDESGLVKATKDFKSIKKGDTVYFVNEKDEDNVNLVKIKSFSEEEKIYYVSHIKVKYYMYQKCSKDENEE